VLLSIFWTFSGITYALENISEKNLSYLIWPSPWARPNPLRPGRQAQPPGPPRPIGQAGHGRRRHRQACRVRCAPRPYKGEAACRACPSCRCVSLAPLPPPSTSCTGAPPLRQTAGELGVDPEIRSFLSHSASGEHIYGVPSSFSSNFAFRSCP
jgi:hypothetical protein